MRLTKGEITYILERLPEPSEVHESHRPMLVNIRKKLKLSKLHAKPGDKDAY